MAQLEGKIVIVTGGAGGIGGAIAAGFAQEGARTWIADLSESSALQAASQIGPECHGISLDVQDLESIAHVVKSVTKQAGGIDVLVNCAGAYCAEPWLEMTPNNFDLNFAVNTRGLAFMTQAVANAMIAQNRRGTIVNVASGAGRRGDPISVAYSASKAAAISLTQSAALALAPHGIRVNAIAPGPVSTPMWTTALAQRSSRTASSEDVVMQNLRARVPLARVSMPMEQVGAVLFLASDASSFVTGQTLNVDGGMFLN